MGVESTNAPPLPAPTETESNALTEQTSDFASDLTSCRGGDEKSSYSLPDDGTPVTIKTRGHNPSKSQTSLLIEYFEGGKAGISPDRKPSVRVRLTPSSKSRESDHIQITKTKSSRKTSAAMPVPLSQAGQSNEPVNVDNLGSCASATAESNISHSIEVEVDRTNRGHRRPASPLIPTLGAESSRASNIQSDISAIPTDSFFDGSSGREVRSLASPHKTDSFFSAGLPIENMPQKPSTGRERPAAPKTKDRDRKHKPSTSKSRASTSSDKHSSSGKTTKKTSRSHQEPSASLLSAPDSSVLSSQLTGSQHSKVSGTSKASGSSINNPKLLETVEDAIRRLILPELNALKREQSRRGPRPESLTASSSVTNTSRDSRDSRDDRSERRRSTRSADSWRHESRNREARNDIDDASTPEADDDTTELRLEDNDTPRKGQDKPKAATAIAALGASTALSPGAIDQPSSDASKRRRRRSEKKPLNKSREDIYNQDDQRLEPPMPPMPLSSDVNPSELTRTSILSADTDRPHSATEEAAPIREASRRIPSAESTPTQTQTPPASVGHLGTSHANVSHGDLKELPQRRTGEFPKGIEGPVQPEEDEYDEEEEDSYQPGYPGYYDQDVPAPLNYVPYQPASRGLSPIESISGYTDGHSEVQQQQRDSRLMQTSGSHSPEKPEEGISNMSAPSNVHSHGIQDSEIGSLQSSTVERYGNSTYMEDSEVDRVQSGQAVHVIGANPELVQNPIGVESNVATLFEGSLVEPSVLSTGYNQQQYGSRESMASRGSPSQRSQSPAEARGISPGSPSVASRRQLFEERMESPLLRKSNLSREYQEYELDQYGRKVPITTTTVRQQVESPTPSETAITGAAVDAAAAALKAKSKQGGGLGGADMQRNKSFKERAKVHEPAVTPKHSVDCFSLEEPPKMQATADPDFTMPEIGYGLDDHSMVDDKPDEATDDIDDGRSANATPTPRTMDRGMGFADVAIPVTAASAAAAVVTNVGTAPFFSHSRQPSQDPSEDFRRTSHDHKRDTIITNPYENASPVTVPVLPDAGHGILDDAIPDQYGSPPAFPGGTPGLQQKVDEGYISQGPNRTPDMRAKDEAVDFMGQNQYPGPIDDPLAGQKGHVRHLSGMSQGMASPFYDGATGTGIDRIENKDIVALMQHLMVRDAQRSARDTEILVTLVRTAADMRNSFDAVTKLLGDVENTIVTEVQDNTEKTVRMHVGGPRPYPGSNGAKSIQTGSQAGTDEVAAKKASLFKRALKGLSAKGSNDLGRIEDMLMRLLSEVDVLKAQTAGPRIAAPQPSSLDALQPAVQYEQDRGYEPDGIAGTSTASHGSQSGHLSLPQRGPSAKLGYDRKFVTENRISTVHEHEDEYSIPETPTPRQEGGNFTANPDVLMSPADKRHNGSAPSTPQGAAVRAGTSASQENTPKDKGKKNKSKDSQGWFPKISRWSETTASSVGNKFRLSGTSKKNESGDLVVQQAPALSGSELGAYDAEGFLRTDPEGDDKIRLQTGYSEPDLAGSMRQTPPNPSTYMTPEDPKYKAHRNSVNLQHPQPRPGNTDKHKLALETSAQEFDPHPTSPRSGNWAGSAPSLNRLGEEPAHYAHSSHEATDHHEEEYWGPASQSTSGPPRPPKEPLDHDSAASPAKSRISKLQQQQQQRQSPLPFHSVESGYGTATTAAEYVSPKLENKKLSSALGVPARRPTGPRAMTPKNVTGEESPDERRRKRDTFGTMTSQESETF